MKVTEVYPRTGGGNASCAWMAVAVRGLSPHGRGKLRREPAFVLAGGSIPARAGETWRG